VKVFSSFLVAESAVFAMKFTSETMERFSHPGEKPVAIGADMEVHRPSMAGLGELLLAHCEQGNIHVPKVPSFETTYRRDFPGGFGPSLAREKLMQRERCQLRSHFTTTTEFHAKEVFQPQSTLNRGPPSIRHCSDAAFTKSFIQAQNFANSM